MKRVRGASVASEPIPTATLFDSIHESRHGPKLARRSGPLPAPLVGAERACTHAGTGGRVRLERLSGLGLDVEAREQRLGRRHAARLPCPGAPGQLVEDRRAAVPVRAVVVAVPSCASTSVPRLGHERRHGQADRAGTPPAGRRARRGVARRRPRRPSFAALASSHGFSASTTLFAPPTNSHSSARASCSSRPSSRSP